MPEVNYFNVCLVVKIKNIVGFNIFLLIFFIITFLYFMTDSSAHCGVIPKYYSVSGLRVRLTLYKLFIAKQKRAILVNSLLNGILGKSEKIMK